MEDKETHPGHRLALEGSLQHLESPPPLPTGPLTREALRDELRFFAQEGALKRQLADVETRLREKVHAELRDVLGELRDCQRADLSALFDTPEGEFVSQKRSQSSHARREVNFNMRGYYAMREVRELGEKEQKEHSLPHRQHGHGHGHGHGRRKSSMFSVFPESIVPQSPKTGWKSGQRGAERDRAQSDAPVQGNALGDGLFGSVPEEVQFAQRAPITTAAPDFVEVAPFGQSTVVSGIEDSLALEAFSSNDWDLPSTESNDDGAVTEYSSAYQFESTRLQQSTMTGHDSESQDDMADASGSCCPWSRRTSFTIVHSGWFDYAIGLAILANAVQLGLQTDFVARNRGDKPPTIFRILELIFCALFTCELILRLLSESTRFFCMKGWQWNLFDMLVISIQLLEELIAVASQVLSSSSSSSSDTPSFNLSFLRVLRVLRLVRIIRLVRILRLISELRTLIMSIISSLKSLGWTLLLLFLMIYSFSVYFTQLVADHDGDTHPELYKYYGTLDATILALFQSITGGIDWQAVVEPLMETLSPWYALIFSFYIAFSVLAVLNVVTGVFVESALLSAKSDQDFFMINNVRELFELVTFDRAEGLGKRADELAMTWEDFRSKIHSQQMQDYFKSIDVDPSNAHGIFHLLDADGSGSVTFEEFVSGCCRLRGSAKSLDVHIMLYELRRLTDKVDSHGKELEGLARAKKMAQQQLPELLSRRSKLQDMNELDVQQVF